MLPSAQRNSCQEWSGGPTEETAMEEATEAAQLRHFDLRTWKAIELIAGHRTSSETIGVIAFDDLFDQLVLAAVASLPNSRSPSTGGIPSITTRLRANCRGLSSRAKPIP